MWPRLNAVQLLLLHGCGAAGDQDLGGAAIPADSLGSRHARAQSPPTLSDLGQLAGHPGDSLGPSGAEAIPDDSLRAWVWRQFPTTRWDSGGPRGGIPVDSLGPWAARLGLGRLRGGCWAIGRPSRRPRVTPRELIAHVELRVLRVLRQRPAAPKHFQQSQKVTKIVCFCSTVLQALQF